MVYGRVYSIRSHQTTDIYIGSTTQILSKRMADHRSNYKKYLNGTFDYVSSFEILQYKDCYIELLFEGEFESKNALDRKEGEYQREMNCVNKNIAGRTPKERYEENKEKLLQKKKKYYVDNRKIKLEKANQNYKDNREIKLEKANQYAKEHQEQIKENNRQKITCECGSTICKISKSTHIKSKKHQAFILSESVAKNCDEVRSSSGQSSENSEVLM
jgi:hypothetical protein